MQGTRTDAAADCGGDRSSMPISTDCSLTGSGGIIGVSNSRRIVSDQVRRVVDITCELSSVKVVKKVLGGICRYGCVLRSWYEGKEFYGSATTSGQPHTDGYYWAITQSRRAAKNDNITLASTPGPSHRTRLVTTRSLASRQNSVNLVDIDGEFMKPHRIQTYEYWCVLFFTRQICE